MGRSSTTPHAISNYAGIRLTITQPGRSREAFVALSTKRRVSGWDDWGLLHPPLRQALPPLSSADDITVALMLAVQSLIARERAQL